MLTMFYATGSKSWGGAAGRTGVTEMQKRRRSKVKEVNVLRCLSWLLQHTQMMLMKIFNHRHHHPGQTVRTGCAYVHVKFSTRPSVANYFNKYIEFSICHFRMSTLQFSPLELTSINISKQNRRKNNKCIDRAEVRAQTLVIKRKEQKKKRKKEKKNVSAREKSIPASRAVTRRALATC